MSFLKFFRSKDDNYSIEANEKSFGEMLDYVEHYDENTIITKNDDLISIIRIQGFSFETADDIDLESKKQMRNNMLKGLAGDNVSFWFHTIRKEYSNFPEGDFDNIFTKKLNEKWKEKQKLTKSFINEHYISIIKHINSKDLTSNLFEKIKYIIEKLLGKKKHEIRQKIIKEAYQTLIEVRERIITSFNQYQPYLLGQIEENNIKFSEICKFLAYIANLGHDQKMRVPTQKISSYINTSRIYFGNNIEVQSLHNNKIAAIVSLKEYRPGTFSGMLDGFLKLQFEFIITQSYQFTEKMTAISKMQLQQRRLMQSEDVAISQIAEIDSALDAAMSGMFGFGLHHLTIMVIADDKKQLDLYLSQAVVAFSNIGVLATIENMNLEPAFWSQFPGHSQYIVRKATINTLNLASYASFHNYPSGKINQNHWGDAVTVMQTTSGTPYFFNFHTRDVGHTMIIGPTGAGKTMLLNFLATQAQKFKPRLFFFDKDCGAFLFIKSIRGKYTIINPGSSCHFNPFLLPDNAENRNFLTEWIKILVSSNGENVSAQEIEIINHAIDGAYRLPEKDRKLSNIASFFGIEIGDSLAVRLKMWHSNGAKAGIFDNDHDWLNFQEGKTFGFDMAEILKDPIALMPILLYIFHKITLSLDGYPTMIILDEAWSLISNPIFAPKIKDWLKVLRKLNAFVVFATQSVEDAANSSISDTLVQQTATQIFLPNLKATDVYKSVFMLTEREYHLVKTTDPSTRYFLLKQDINGVMARVNLNGMNDMINILSGRIDLVKQAQEIYKEYGDDPDTWLPIFWKQVK